jgi:hypothetical protein
MTEPKEPLSCPCCGGKSVYTPADRSIRQPDLVMCLECGLELMTDYELGSALAAWDNTAPTRTRS